MSVESLRKSEDIASIIVTRNKDDRQTRKSAFSIYHSLALQFKEEGTDGLRHRKIGFGQETDAETNYAAIVFGLTMRGIEIALKEGIFDSYENLVWYNEAVTGTLYRLFDHVYTEPTPISETVLQNMRKFSAKDRTHATFFTSDEAYNCLPNELRWLMEYTKTIGIIRSKVIPTYVALAQLLPPPPKFQPIPKVEATAAEKTTKQALTEKDPKPTITDNQWAWLEQKLKDKTFK